MLIKNRRWLCDLVTRDFDPVEAKKYAPRDRLMRHRTRGGCMDEPLKRIRSAWCQQCHTEGGRVDTIGVLGRPGSPGARWGAAGSATTCPGPPPSSSSSSPGLTPLLPSLQTKSTRSIGPGSCDSQDAQDVHQRPQRLGNKEVLELVLGSRWYPQPFNAADERQSAGNETRTSWDELRRGHHNMIWERSQVFSARTKRWPERNN